MKKLFKFMFKLVAILASIIGVLFTVYITNLDSRLVEVLYDILMKYHDNKVKKDII